MPVGGAGLTQLGNNCFVHTDIIAGQTTATRLVGRIYRQDTGDRPGPPDCLNGFGCGGTPFAKGHIMALELGGADIPANIVPQYGQWQGNAAGAWRRMEVAVRDAANDADVFIADIAYQGPPLAETYQQQYQRFSAGEKLLHWKNPLIPERFRVWTVAQNWTGGGTGVAAYFAAGDAGKDQLVAGLIGALPDARKVFDVTIDAMPDIDRNYWRAQMVADFARSEHRLKELTDELENDRIRQANQRAQQTFLAQQNALRLAARARAGDGDDRPAGGGKMMRQQTRVSSRTNNSSSPYARGPALQREIVTPSLANWLADDTVAAQLHAKLVDTNNPQRAVSGWTPVELATFTQQQIAACVFQQ